MNAGATDGGVGGAGDVPSTAVHGGGAQPSIVVRATPLQRGECGDITQYHAQRRIMHNTGLYTTYDYDYLDHLEVFVTPVASVSPWPKQVSVVHYLS